MNKVKIKKKKKTHFALKGKLKSITGRQVNIFLGRVTSLFYRYS